MSTEEHEELYDDDLSSGTGTGFTRKPTQNTGSGLNPLTKWKDHQRKKKEKNALSKGYIRWYLVDDSISKPKYIQPEFHEGGNIPEFEHKGDTYLFPEDTMIPDADDGIWTVMHREGEAEPIDLRNANEDPIKAHALHEYLTMRVTDTNPGGLGLPGLGNITGMQALQYLIFGIIGLAILSQVMP